MSELRIVQGNNFGTAIEITAVDATGHAIQDFSLEGSTDIRVWYVYGGKEVEIDGWTIQDGKILILWPKDLRFGTYDLFQSGMYGETSWRNAMRAQFTIVKYNYEANIPDDVIVLDGIYQLSAQMAIITQISGGGGIPSDADPLMDGTASPGTDTKYSRGDHRHPSDTSKQDIIADLDAIRSGAQKGATAYQKPTNGIPSTDMAQAVQTSLGKADTAYQKPANGIPATDLASAVQTSLGKADTAYQNPSSGIPATDLASVVQTSLGKADTAYQKPSSGIPATDLASAVQTSLGKADTSIQSVKVNGTALTPDANKAVDVSVPTVIDSLSSASTTSALSANQGKVLNESKQDKIDNSHKLSADLVDDTSTTNKFVTSSEKSTWNGKQDAISDLATIRSGAALGATSVQSVKTINGNTMTGTGNVSTMTPVTNHGTSDTTYSVTPNVLHIWGTVASLSLTLATPTDNTIKNEYMIQFTSGATATQFSLPQGVEWGTQDPEQPNPLVVKANAIYQISIENNIGLWTSIANS